MEIPKSVRQIGQLKGNRKIYMEDYVWTFTRQLAKQAGEREVAGVLLGTTVSKKSERFYFISGMVEIEHFDLIEEPQFTSETWTSIYTEIKENFSGVEILGWFYAKAEMPLAVTERTRQIHGKNFPGNDKLMYLYENGEDEDAFFFNFSGTMEQQQGYYIYYEKNPEMQEYMITHKKPERIDGKLDERAMKTMRGILDQKQETGQERERKVSYGLVACLALMALVCGYLALRNQDTLSKVESQMASIRQSVGGATSTPDTSTSVEVISQTVATITPAAVSASPEITEAPVTSPIVIAKKYDLYIVKKGDTLMGIAKAYYADVNQAERIRKYNKMKKNDVLLIGQKLKLPI